VEESHRDVEGRGEARFNLETRNTNIEIRTNHQ